jgi:hypothetical protein
METGGQALAALREDHRPAFIIGQISLCEGAMTASDTLKKGIDRKEDEERQDHDRRYLFPVVVGFHGVRFCTEKHKPDSRFPGPD